MVEPPPAFLPILPDEDDAAIAAALESASVPALMAAMVHITGDVDILRSAIRPKPPIPGEVQGFLTPDEQARVRAQALDVLKAFRDGGCRLPPPPSHETLRELIDFVAGEALPEEYLPMMLEELALSGDERQMDWSDVPAAKRAGLRVAIIGAGMSGLLTAIRLEEAGIPYVVLEKNPAVGGTWYENTYPGCRVDIKNHFYAYSFEPNHDWSEFFSQRDELFAYFERCADRYGVRDHIRFETEVRAARWNDDASLWQLEVCGPDGRVDRIDANVLVSAVGQLNRPASPRSRGSKTSRGQPSTRPSGATTSVSRASVLPSSERAPAPSRSFRRSRPRWSTWSCSSARRHGWARTPSTTTRCRRERSGC